MIPEVCGAPDAARVILERGLFHLGKTRWNVAFYLGMIYYKYYGDRETAARYFAMAARVPSEHSHKLANLAAMFYSEAGKQQEGRDFLLFMYNTSENPEVRRHLAEKIHEGSG